MLILRGAAALSDFRLEKLRERLAEMPTPLRLLSSEYVHFASLTRPLTDDESAVLVKLLEYGPRPGADTEPTGASGSPLVVVPRPGTISPWSSKATDIAHNCGLVDVERLERGCVVFLYMPEVLSASQLSELDALVHDRMTESVLEALAGAECCLKHAQPAPLTALSTSWAVAGRRWWPRTRAWAGPG